MRVVAFVVATAAVIATGVLVVVRLRLRSTLETLLAWLVVSTASVIGLVLLVGGVLRSLRPTPLLVAALVLLGLTIGVVTRGEGLRPGWLEFRDRLQATFRTVFQRSTLREHPFACVLVGLAVADLAWIAAGALLLPPLAFDSLSYHLPAVAYWVQHGEISRTPFGVYANFYPFNGESVTAWSATLLRSDVFANSAQIPFALCGALGTALIARIVGLRKASAAMAASLFLLAPVVAEQAKVAYVDLALAGAFLAALAFALRGLQCLGVVRTEPPAQTPRMAPRYFVLAGLAAGVAAGAKEVGPLYAGVLLLTIVGALVVRRENGIAVAARVLCAFIVPLLLLGSFWFVRNAVDYGNPLHPWDVNVAGVTLLHGVRGSSTQIFRGEVPKEISDVPALVRPLVSWAHEPKSKYLFDDRLGGLGVVWTFVALPSLVAFAIWCARRRRDLLMTFLVPVGVIFVLQPDNWWSRFTIVLLGPGLVAVAFVYEWLRSRMRTLSVVFGALLCVFALQQFVATRDAGFVGPSAVGHQAKVLVTKRYIERSTFPEYEVANALDKRLPHAVIATRKSEVPHRLLYPLIGGRFQHQLVILHGHGEQQLRHELDAAHSIGAVVTKKGSALDRAVVAEPDRFALVARVGTNRIYRVQ